MLCSCGRPISTLLSESDADQRAVNDLNQQARESSGVMATLIRARRDQLKAEIAAESEFEIAMNKSTSSLLETIEQAVQTAGPDLILNASDDQLLDLLIRGGLGAAIDDFITQQNKIRSSIGKTLSAVEPDFSLDSLSNQIDTLSGQNSLRDLELAVPLNTVMSNLQTRMKRAQGSQLTEIKTKISQYGRGITAIAAEVAGLDHYLYTGPRDGITRPFCRALVNKVVTESQMGKLNNGQGLSVKTSGGGYNCRHSWSPVTDSFIQSADLTRAKPSDISDANKGGKK
mgnify:CR=1 FL=1